MVDETPAKSALIAFSFFFSFFVVGAGFEAAIGLTFAPADAPIIPTGIGCAPVDYVAAADAATWGVTTWVSSPQIFLTLLTASVASPMVGMPPPTFCCVKVVAAGVAEGFMPADFKYPYCACWYGVNLSSDYASTSPALKRFDFAWSYAGLPSASCCCTKLSKKFKSRSNPSASTYLSVKGTLKMRSLP